MEYSFGNWVKRRRKALDLTQHELAQRVGCSVATITKIESDERRPSRQIAELLALHLEIPIDQRERFLKIARQEKSVVGLHELTNPGESPTKPGFSIQRTSEPLIGREVEITQITNLLRDPKCRLLTLTGAGGIGKTRLATETAFQQQNQFEYGALFVNLAPLGSRDQIVTAIADALGVVLYTASDRASQLIAHLHQREVLLVLDNFEHLVNQADCASLPGDLLIGAPQIKLLITSREPLQLQSEWVFEVRGLPVPETDPIDFIETSSAMRLFVQCARQTKLDFELTAEDRLAARRICQLVGGVPLAIKLAASWVRTLACNEIVQEIQTNSNFLTTYVRDIAERHRSLRATFDYSWKLLPSDEQVVLRRLSVFKGGFTREAAEHVARANLSRLSSLVSKSLVYRTGPGRYDLHELVLQYSLEYLAENPAEYVETQDHHSDYYLSLLDRREAGFKGADQPTVAQELAAEIANLRQAWRWAGERGKVKQIAQAAEALFWLYESRCDCREGVPLFGHVVKKLEEANESAAGAGNGPDRMWNITRARVMSMQGFFCLRQGQHPQSKEVLERSLAILRSFSEDRSPETQGALSYTLAFLGMVSAALGNYAGGRQYLHEALQIQRAIKDLWGIAFCLRQLGLLAYFQGDYDEAHQLLREGLTVSRAIGNSWATAYSLDFLSTVTYARGEYEESEKLLQEGLALSTSVGDQFTAAYALNGLGLVKQALGDHEEARLQLEKSIAIWREIGDSASLAQSLNFLGDVFLDMGARAEAQKCYLEALAVGRTAGLVPIMLDALLGNALLRAREGEDDFAFKISAYIKDHVSSTQPTKSRAEKLYAKLLPSLARQSKSFAVDPHHRVLEQFVDDVLRKSATMLSMMLASSLMILDVIAV